MNSYKRQASNSGILRVELYDSSSTTGALLASLAFNSAGLVIEAQRELDASKTSYTVAASNVEDITTLGTYAAPTASKIRFKETQLGGVYELHPAQALLGTGDASRYCDFKIYGATNLVPRVLRVWLTATDQQDGVRMGLTALPNAAADAAGGLPISDAGGLDLDAQRADVAAILVDTGTTLDGRLPAALVGGRMDASVGAMATDVITSTAVAASAVTEFQAGLALSSELPANFSTLTIGSNAVLAKLGDLAHGGTSTTITIERLIATSTTLNEPAFKLLGNGSGAGFQATGGSSAGNGIAGFGGTGGDGMQLQGSGAGDALHVNGDLNISGNTSLAGTLGLTGALTATNAANNLRLGTFTASMTGSVGSVTGAVGSVAGNVGGNVVGSVGSVTAAVTLPTIPADWITGAGVAASAVTEFQAGLSTLDAAAVRSAVGLAAANLDSQLNALPTANENADALLDRADGIETGVTLRQAMRAVAAAAAGKRSGSGTASEQFDAIGNPGTARIVPNADAAGDGIPTLSL